MTRLLVVDDDAALARALQINFTAHGYEVSVAHDGRSALDLFAHRHPHLVVLDLGLPDLDGLEVLAGIRGYSATPVIVLSARSTSVEKVAALDAGADDYVTKPFGMDELLARIRVAIRRRESSATAETTALLTTEDFTLDLAAHRAVRGGLEVKLTPTEWALLEILIAHSGRLVPSAQLLREVWGPTYEGQTNYLRVYVAQLRRKLEPQPSTPRYLITVAGSGYRWQATGA